MPCVAKVVPYKSVYIDITGKCNAFCPFCERGARRSGLLPRLQKQGLAFMDGSRFESIFKHLLGNRIIANDCHLAFFNWGEPLINPHFTDIMRVVKSFPRFKGKIVLSTNGGNNFHFSREFMPDLPLHITYTVQGFSQKSYDKGSRFNFNKVMANIKSMANSLRSLYSYLAPVDSTAVYLLYKHNINELYKLPAFANEIGANYHVTVAYLNSLNIFFKYIDSEFNEEKKEFIDSHIIMDHFDLIRKMRPKNYICPQLSRLVIDTDGRICIGCCSRLDHEEDYFGDIVTMNLQDTYNVREDSAACKKCQDENLDFFINSAPELSQKIFANLIHSYLARKPD